MHKSYIPAVFVLMNILRLVQGEMLSSKLLKLVEEDEKRLNFPHKPTQEELKRLTPEQYDVTQNRGTERAFTGELLKQKGDGVYSCVVCNTELFNSKTKFESGSGWPSFHDVIEQRRVVLKRDTTHGMVRVEVLCGNCGSHLGHVFDDGPKPSGLRYCTNSASLSFVCKSKEDL